MSLQHAAKYLAKQGRGEDTMLVHMTPREVKGLQAIAMAHGGSLSINPHTGLPEASFLSKMMPMIIGAGLAAATGGTSLALTPGMIGLGVGGLETLRTGDIGKGITAGLGAYGGAGLAGGLAGAATAAQTPTAQALQSNIDPSMLEGMSSQQVAATGDMGQRLAMTGEGVTGLGNQAGRAGFMQGVGGGMGLAKSGLAAAAPFLMEQPEMPQQNIDNSPNPYRYRFERGEANPFPQPSATGVEQSYFPNARYVAYAGGGQAGGMSNFGSFGDPSSGVERLAGGGLSDLGGYSDGGRLLRGPGDGVSDSIPAVIGAKQPARLADGEFVVPARIVSELGNGSTEAGARKLYAMMDRVQKARSKTVGKDRIAKNTRADKHLPA
jgi:hypothetical protein